MTRYLNQVFFAIRIRESFKGTMFSLSDRKIRAIIIAISVNFLAYCIATWILMTVVTMKVKRDNTSNEDYKYAAGFHSVRDCNKFTAEIIATSPVFTVINVIFTLFDMIFGVIQLRWYTRRLHAVVAGNISRVIVLNSRQPSLSGPMPSPTLDSKEPPNEDVVELGATPECVSPTPAADGTQGHVVHAKSGVVSVGSTVQETSSDVELTLSAKSSGSLKVKKHIQKRARSASTSAKRAKKSKGDYALVKLASRITMRATANV
jgi:hypothetical protein